MNAKNRLRLDIHLDEPVIPEPVSKVMDSHHPDIGSYEAYAYALEEILVEKLRSILQGVRAEITMMYGCY